MRPPGLYAEFPTPEAMAAALTELSRLGLDDVETYTPFDVRGKEADPRGEPRPEPGWLPPLALALAVGGGLMGYWIQWYANAVAYPLNAGGRPTHAVPAFVYPTFEALALAGALTLFLGLLVSLRLPALWQPVFEVEGFESASDDRYWLAVALPDAHEDAAAEREVRASLERNGARRVTRGEVDVR